MVPYRTHSIHLTYLRRRRRPDFSNSPRHHSLRQPDYSQGHSPRRRRPFRRRRIRLLPPHCHRRRRRLRLPRLHDHHHLVLRRRLHRVSLSDQELPPHARQIYRREIDRGNTKRGEMPRNVPRGDHVPGAVPPPVLVAVC